MPPTSYIAITLALAAATVAIGIASKPRAAQQSPSYASLVAVNDQAAK